MGVPVFSEHGKGLNRPRNTSPLPREPGRVVYASDKSTEKRIHRVRRDLVRHIISGTKELVITALEGIGFNATDELDVPDPDVGHYSMIWYGVI